MNTTTQLHTWFLLPPDTSSSYQEDGSKAQRKQAGIWLEDSLMTVSVDWTLKSIAIYQTKDFMPDLIACESSEGSISSC